LPILWAAIDKLDHEYAPAYFKLLILTGLRRNTLRRLNWSNVSLSDRLIHVPRAIDKTRKSQELHLSEFAIEILKGIRRQDPHLFWSRAGNQWGKANGAQMSDSQVGHYWGKVRDISGLDLRIHDLRRTTGSYLAQEGVNSELIGKLLHHIPGSSATAIYTRFVDQNQRDAVELHSRIVRSNI
jgi:integrase